MSGSLEIKQHKWSDEDINLVKVTPKRILLDVEVNGLYHEFYLDENDIKVMSEALGLNKEGNNMKENTHMVKVLEDSAWIPAIKNEFNDSYFVREGNTFSVTSYQVFIAVPKDNFCNHYKFDLLVEDAVKEAQKAMVKFPQPNYVLLKVSEEAGEVVKEGVHCSEGRGDYDNLQAEIKQTIAMLYRLCVEGDETIGLKPALAKIV